MTPWTLLILTSLTVFAIDSLVDTGLTPWLMIGIVAFVLLRWRHDLDGRVVIVAVGLLVLSLLDLFDAGVLPTLRIR